jgi:hypothetical protein
MAAFAAGCHVAVVLPSLISCHIEQGAYYLQLLAANVNKVF